MNDTGFIYGEIPSFIRAYVHFAEKRFKGSKHLVESKKYEVYQERGVRICEHVWYTTLFLGEKLYTSPPALRPVLPAAKSPPGHGRTPYLPIWRFISSFC